MWSARPRASRASLATIQTEPPRPLSAEAEHAIHKPLCEIEIQLHRWLASLAVLSVVSELPEAPQRSEFGFGVWNHVLRQGCPNLGEQWRLICSPDDVRESLPLLLR